MSTFKKIARSFVVAYPEAQIVLRPVRKLTRGFSRRQHDTDFWLLAHLDAPADTVLIDAGANVGNTVARMRSVDPDTAIVAFEPSDTNFASLQNRTRKLTGVTLHKVALHESETETTFYVPGYRNHFYGSLASLDYESARSWLPNFAGYFLNPDKVMVREEKVVVRPLDAFELAPRFIKIDVQGVAPALLRGAASTLAEHRPVLLVERERNDGVNDILAPLGYREYAMQGRTLRPYAGEKDALFVPSEGPVKLRLPDPAP